MFTPILHHPYTPHLPYMSTNFFTGKFFYLGRHLSYTKSKNFTWKYIPPNPIPHPLRLTIYYIILLYSMSSTIFTPYRIPQNNPIVKLIRKTVLDYGQKKRGCRFCLTPSQSFNFGFYGILFIVACVGIATRPKYEISRFLCL
jgi:hypothetical protein